MSADVLAWGLAQPQGSLTRALAEAYMTGAEEVVHDGVRVRYRSRADMMRVLSESYEGTLSTASRRPAATYARYNRGY